MSNALIVVDIQNDFADPRGTLFVRGAHEIFGPVNRLIHGFRDHLDVVIFTSDIHPSNSKHFNRWPLHCVEGTWGANLHPKLDFGIRPTMVLKGMTGDGYSGFGKNVRILDRQPYPPPYLRTGIVSKKNPPLADLLLRNKVHRLVVVGLALDYCVKATALDAIKFGFHVTVPLAATAPVSESGGIAAIAELKAAGISLLPSKTEGLK